ncbi:hypothetical protein NHF39_23155 [Pseudomonas proteolytica]|nr:hypothetical protein NHF39_23155 [Pseudomonas proteolytica]
MTNITREEIDTKLQLIEERLDRKVGDIATAISDLKSSNQQTVRALSNAKWWAIGTAIAVLSIFLGTLQWGLSAQKEENARFNSYVREDVRGIADDAKEISKSVTEMRINLEHSESQPQSDQARPSAGLLVSAYQADSFSALLNTVTAYAQ